MPLNTLPFPKPEWSPLPHPGCAGVEFRVLLRLESVLLAQLRLGPRASINEHSADFDIDVICLEGSGFVGVGEDSAPLAEGSRVPWPAGVAHRLWTTESSLLTLMVEHQGVGLRQ